MHKIERKRKVGVSQNSIHEALKRIWGTYKKTLKHPQRQASKSVLSSRRKFKNSIIYIDEGGFANDMPRTHSHARLGSRCFGMHDWNARGQKSVIAGLSESSLIGCGTIESNIDTAVFNTWIEKILIPDLPENSVVIMDNASFYRANRPKI